MQGPQRHTLSYIEFGVTDLAATRAFYESAFGWSFNDYGPAYSGIRTRRTGPVSGWAEPGRSAPATMAPRSALLR